jgi:putative FmdB family regulatory protein
MPLYDFPCDACGHEFEARESDARRAEREARRRGEL